MSTRSGGASPEEVVIADSDGIFLRSCESTDVAAAQIAAVLGLVCLGRMPSGEMQYKVRARTFDDWIGVFIQRNYFTPEPGEVQAMDGYPVMVDVQCRIRKPAQAEEARLASKELTQALPEMPALLLHQVTMLVAAYLPGRGTHYFDQEVTVDDPDIDIWRPWVVG